MSNLIKFCQETNLVCLSKFMGVILSYSCFEHSSMLTEGDIYAYMQTCFTFLKRSKKTKETHQGCRRWPAIFWGRFYPGSLEAPHPSPRSGLQLYKKNPWKLLRLKISTLLFLSIYQRTTSTNDQAELSVHIINKDRPEPERRTVIPRPQPHRSSSQLTRFNFLRANGVPLLRLLHLCHLRPLGLAAPLVTKRPRNKETVKYVRRTCFVKERKRINCSDFRLSLELGIVSKTF